MCILIFIILARSGQQDTMSNENLSICYFTNVARVFQLMSFSG